MTSTKTRIAIISTAVIGAAMICGCGQSHAKKQNEQPKNTPAPTEWNDSSTQLSPFTKVRYDGEKVMVTYNGVEYELTAINGLSTSEILDFCRSQYAEKWQKRFAEDLVPVLHDMGHPVSADHTVSLTLIDTKTGQKTEIASAAMTQENRNAVQRALPTDIETPTAK